MANLDSILKKQRHHFANKGLSSQSYGFWLDVRCENWTIKNAECQRLVPQIVVLDKTVESPLDSKEIETVNPKGNQSGIFIGRTDAKAEAPVLWSPDAKSWFIGKDPDAGKDWGGEGNRGWDGWITSLTQWTWVWASSGRQRRPGKPGVLQPTGSQRVGHDLVAKQQQHSLQGTTHWTIVLWEKIGGSTAVFSCSSYIKISRLCILLWWAWGLLVCMEACLGLLRYGKIH